jgi:hypothetical protein
VDPSYAVDLPTLWDYERAGSIWIHSFTKPTNYFPACNFTSRDAARNGQSASPASAVHSDQQIRHLNVIRHRVGAGAALAVDNADIATRRVRRVGLAHRTTRMQLEATPPCPEHHIGRYRAQIQVFARNANCGVRTQSFNGTD